MNNEWIKVTLADLGSFKNGANFNAKQYGDAHPVVSVKSLFRGRFAVTEGLDAIQEGVISKIENYLLVDDDILFARSSLKRSGSGQTAIVKNPPKGTIFSGFTIRFRSNNKNIVDALFLLYNLKSPVSREVFARIATGTTISNLSQANLSSFPINLPPLSEQKAIAHILGKLDDKIELNRQMNQTLEEMAQALFKSWFVDFDPVFDNALAAGNEIPDALKAKAELRSLVPDEKKLLHSNPELAEGFPSSFVFNETLDKLIPEGWGVKTIDSFGKVVCGKTPPKANPENYGGVIPFIKIPNMHNEVFVMQASEYLSNQGSQSQINKLLPKGSISVSCIATVGKVIITKEPSHTNQQINSIVPTNTKHRYFLYFYMLSLERYFHDLASGGSTTLNMNTSTFSKVNVLYPTLQIVSQFHEKVSPLFSKILLNQEKNETLTQLRDTLLPQLISGKVRVPEGFVDEMANDEAVA